MDQRVEAAEAVEVAGDAVERLRGARDRGRRVGIRPGERAKLRLKLAGAPADMDTGGRKVGEGVAELIKRRMRVAEDASVVERADGQLVRIVGPYREAPLFRVEFQDEMPSF